MACLLQLRRSSHHRVANREEESSSREEEDMPEVFGTAARGGSIASFRAQVNRDGSLPQGLSRKYGAGSLVEVVGLEDGGLRFEGVFLNGLHSLRRISLKNTSANVGEGGGSTVVVRLGSTVGDQVRFQLSNPNCPDSLPAEFRHLATNTAGAADKLAYLESNALFDAVGFVREVTIAPGETQSVVVAFRPDSAHSRPSLAPFLDPSTTAAARADSHSEHGLSSVSILEGSSLSSFVGSGPAPKAAEQYALATVDGYLNFDACLLPLPGDTTPQATLVPIQQLSIQLSATVCRSHFAVSIAKPSDPSEVFVDWGNQCVVGEVYVRDFEISNRSGIELFWRLDDPEGVASGRGTGSPFLVTDIDKGHYLGSAGSEWTKPASIPPYGSRKLRFIFRPGEAKEVDAEIAFENIGDPDNTIQIHFHAVVASAPRDNTLRLLSGSTIDFCDCVAGEWSQQVIVFKNTANTALEVAFGADKGMDITFRLEGGADAHSALDLDSTSIGANAVELVAPPETETPELPETSSAPSRTIIHELARGPRGSTSALITNSVHSDAGAVPSHAPHPTQSNQFFAASPTSSDQASDSLLSASDRSPPLSYHPAGGFRDARSPLGPNNPTSTQSSRSAAPFPPSKSVHAENSEGGLFRVQDHLKVFEQQNASRIEDIYAKPGVEYRIVVSFRPTRAASIDLDPDGGRLVKKTFRVTVSYRPWGVRGASGPSTKERKPIVCNARVCTSFIAVRPEVIDFGEVELGTSCSGTVSIANLSEIPARVDLRFISKVLSAYRDEITIDVGKTIDIRLDIVPRRTNPAYQKQVSIHNLLNPANSQVCLVKSKNVDTCGVAFHSLFYRLLTSTGGNFEDFGSVPVGAYGLRGIAILNTSSESNLSLELSSAHSEDYELLVRRRVEPSPPAETLPPPNSVSPPPPSPRPAQSRSNSSEIEARVELKERVLDAIFAPTSTAPPAPVRRPPSSNASTASSSAAAASRSIATQLKQGLKVKATQMYGSGMAFKDRGVLSQSEYLDLATGPPLDISRTSPRSKRAILLDSIERSRSSRPSPLSLAAITGVPSSSQPSSILSHSRTRTEEPRIVEIGGSTTTVPVPVTPATPTKRKTSRTPKEASSTSSSSPALTSRRRTRNLFTMPTDPAKLSLDEVFSGLEHHSAHPDSSHLSSPELEDAYVRRFIALRRALKAALKSGELEPVTMLEVPPSSEQIVYILVHPAGTRTQIQGTSRKQDGKISIRLRAPHTGVACPASTEIPLREVVLRWTTCRSAMDLGMAHLNFGILEKSSSKAKKIVIANASEIPLLYSVRKSGSIASGDIRLSEGRHGVIPGYTKREVPLIFNPHYAGTFEETLHVDNVEDGTEETVRLKAYIRKPPTFSCSPPVLDFGACAVHSSSVSLPLTITNTSKVPRVFTLSVDPTEFCFARTISEVILDPSTTSAFPTLTTEEEEEVDAMLQKLKISRRKGQPDKVVKYVARLSELGVAVPVSEEVAAAISLDEGSTGTSPIESDVPAIEGAGEDEGEPKDPTTTPEPKRASSITFALEPNSRRDVMIALLPTLNPLPSEEHAGSTAKEEISGAITIYENADATEKVVVKAVITL